MNNAKKFSEDILSIALIYCGTVFGAGFASGQEIVTFFSVHNFCGILASVFVGFLFSFFGYKICSDSHKMGFNSAGEYFDFLFPKRVSRILNFICISFLVISFCIMITGCGTLFYNQFSVRPVFGALISLVITYIIIKNRVTGLAWFNSLVTPFMFFGVVILSVMCIVCGGGETGRLYLDNGEEAAFSGVLYLSYNLVSAAAVLVPSAKIAKSGKDAALGGALGGVLVSVPLALMAFVLTIFPEYINGQMPFFDLVRNIYPKLSLLCGIILYCAMLTTAAASGVSAVAKLAPKYSKKAALTLCFAAFLVSFIPFDTLVKSVYSVFGLCGLLLVCGIIASFFRKNKIKSEKHRKQKKINPILNK